MSTYINVKDPPYNAAGDGVTDDWMPIDHALSDAAGRTVYFPAGIYLIGTGLVPSSTVILLGDDRDTVTIKCSPTMQGNAVIHLPANSAISNITLDANFALQPLRALVTSGIWLDAGGAKINRCRIRNCSGAGIYANRTSGTRITESEIDNTAEQNISIGNGSRILISNCWLHRCGMSNIQIFYCSNSEINNNIIGPSDPVSAGIYPKDCDNLIMEGNIITRCRTGIEAWTTVGRSLLTGGNQIINNLISRNYNSGLSVASNGMSITGNNISNNGQGGINSVTSTIEPGIKVDPAFPGAGYVPGDILTLVGGTGTPAKVMVLLTFPGGSLYNVPNQDIALYPIDMGNYSMFPESNPVSVMGGNPTTPAKVIYTNSKINTGGSGYAVGDILRATNVPFTQAVRLEITAVSGGAVTGYNLHDGGGYSGTLPNPLNFANEFGGIGRGFTVTPFWGKRYSPNYLWTYGLETIGPVLYCSISGNIITSTLEGPAIVLYDQGAPLNGRMNYSAIVGNVFRNNPYSIKGKTGTAGFDDTIPANNKSDLNIGYP